MMELQVSFNGMEPSEALKNYLEEKIDKFEKLLSEATSISAVFREQVHARGVKEDFSVDINVHLPKTNINVQQSGADMYAAIDGVTDTLARRIKEYRERKRNW